MNYEEASKQAREFGLMLFARTISTEWLGEHAEYEVSDDPEFGAGYGWEVIRLDD